MGKLKRDKKGNVKRKSNGMPKETWSLCGVIALALILTPLAVVGGLVYGITQL